MVDAQVEEVCVFVCAEGEGPERLLRPLRSPCLLLPVLSSALISVSSDRGKVNTALKDSSLIL